MTAPANPWDFPDAWDYILLGGALSPGIAVVTSGGKPYKWDVKEGPGTTGASTTFRGSRLAEPSVQFTIWTREQYEEWWRFVEVFTMDPNKKTLAALDIVHPALNGNGIGSVVPKGIPQLENAGGGKWTATLEFQEYGPPPKKKASGNPKGSKGGSAGSGSGAGGAQDTALSEQEKEIARLLGEAKQP